MFRLSGVVELGGVEPPSKQLTSVLSTCLSDGWLSGRHRTSAPKAALSLLRFTGAPRHRTGYPVFTCTSGSAADGRGGWEMSRSLALRGN